VSLFLSNRLQYIKGSVPERSKFIQKESEQTGDFTFQGLIVTGSAVLLYHLPALSSLLKCGQPRKYQVDIRNTRFPRLVYKFDKCVC
jgi:hypothetical protein